MLYLYIISKTNFAREFVLSYLQVKFKRGSCPNNLSDRLKFRETLCCVTYFGVIMCLWLGGKENDKKDIKFLNKKFII